MSSSAPRRRPEPEASAFDYPEARPPGAQGAKGAAPAVEGADEREKNHARHREQEEQAEQNRSRRIHAEAFEQGRQSAQQQLRSELDAALNQQREQMGEALRQFAVERQDYYRRIEGEVVRLALAIARKVLHREAQVDPQALAGIVRITLEKLDRGAKVDLYVHPPEAAAWRHYFACRVDDAPAAPEIHESAALAAGECRIETSLGTTEVGLQSQLKEIETGLLDLLAERPGAPTINNAPPPTSAAMSAAAGAAK